MLNATTCPRVPRAIVAMPLNIAHRSRKAEQNLLSLAVQTEGQGQQIFDMKVAVNAIDIERRMRGQISNPLAARAAGYALLWANFRACVDAGNGQVGDGASASGNRSGQGRALGAEGQAIAGYFDIHAGEDALTSFQRRANAKM